MNKPTSVDGLTDKLRGLLNKDGVWSSEYNGVLLEIEEAVAKINRLIVEAELRGFDIAFDSHDYDRLRAYREELNNKLKGGNNG